MRTSLRINSFVIAAALAVAGLFATAGQAGAAPVLASYTDAHEGFGLFSGFPGTFLVTDYISSCDPEVCRNLVPIVTGSFDANSTPPLTFTADAANNPNWSTIVALLGNDDNFLTFCTDAGTQTCSSLRADTIGDLFFPAGGGFFGDAISGIGVTFNPLSVSLNPPSGATINYDQTISVLGASSAVPEPGTLVLAAIPLLVLSAFRRRRGVRKII